MGVVKNTVTSPCRTWKKKLASAPFPEEPPGGGPGGNPFNPDGCIDAKVIDTRMAREMSFLGRWGRACGTPFEARRFLAAHPQFDWMEGILKDRPRQSWTQFSAAAQPSWFPDGVGHGRFAPPGCRLAAVRQGL